MTPTATLEDYLGSLAEDRRALAHEIIDLIHASAPGTEPGLRYGLPAFRFGNGVVLHFGFWTRHLGFYPVYRGSTAFEAAISPYRSGKDGVRFSLAKPVPRDLVQMIVLEMSRKPNG